MEYPTLGSIVRFAIISTLVTLVAAYAVLDFISYDYGLSCYDYNKHLPYKLKPTTASNLSFTINDEEGFPVIGIGFKYRTVDFEVCDILSYGYNDTCVIVECSDCTGVKRYLTTAAVPIGDVLEEYPFIFREINSIEKQKSDQQYKWFMISSIHDYNFELYKKYVVFAFLLTMMLLVVVIIWKNRMRKSYESSS